MWCIWGFCQVFVVQLNLWQPNQLIHSPGRLVLDPASRHPLWFPLQQVDFKHELSVHGVDVIKGDDGLKVVAVVVLHVLSNGD